MYLDEGTIVALIIALSSSIAVISLLLRDNFKLRQENNLLHGVVAWKSRK